MNGIAVQFVYVSFKIVQFWERVHDRTEILFRYCGFFLGRNYDQCWVPVGTCVDIFHFGLTGVLRFCKGEGKIFK